MALPKRKPDTETLRAEAQASLQAIDAEIAELDRQRLDLDPQAAVAKEIALAAARRDQQRRVELLDQRAADELRQRQAKAQSALIGRVEAKLAERDAAGAEVAKHLAAAVTAFRKATAANSAVAAGWPWPATDMQACLLGRPFVAHIAYEIYRLAGQPFVSSGVDRQLEFPGGRSPSVTDPRPETVTPLVDALRQASDYASKVMRGSPMRPLPPAPRPTSIEVAPADPPKGCNGSAAAEVPKLTQGPVRVNKAPECEYTFHVDFCHIKTREARTETITLDRTAIEECFLDGIGPTGVLGREAALRLASERVGSDFAFAGQPNSIRFDLARLSQSLERETT